MHERIFMRNLHQRRRSEVVARGIVGRCEAIGERVIGGAPVHAVAVATDARVSVAVTETQAPERRVKVRLAQRRAIGRTADDAFRVTAQLTGGHVGRGGVGRAPVVD